MEIATVAINSTGKARYCGPLREAEASNVASNGGPCNQQVCHRSSLIRQILSDQRNTSIESNNDE